MAVHMDHEPHGGKPVSPTRDAAKILVAEDEKLLRLMMAKLLQVLGHKVYTCDNGLQALELIEKESFDLVITDLLMPGATGMEVLRETRKRQPRAKVIIITDTPSLVTVAQSTVFDSISEH